MLQPAEERLYAEFALPLPSQCPECRRHARLLFRNFFHLYHRTCSLTGKKIISMYREDAPFPVYDTREWSSDRWDALDYGKSIDWSAPFFEQVGLLHRTVPRMTLLNFSCENSEYCNMAANTRGSYLVFGCVANEECMYGHSVWKCNQCYDCLYCYQSARCYECVDCMGCHSLAFSRACENCSSSSFLVHCTGCRDCFGCVGLKNKQYHIFNEPHSKEEYERKMKEFNSGSHRILAFAQTRLQKLVGTEIVKHYHGINCEDVTGDYLYNSKKTVECYDLKNSQDARYCTTGDGFVDCVDCDYIGVSPIERCVSCLTAQGYELLFCHCCFNNSARLWYCDHCFATQDCFGCVGLKNKRYCILNKQYSKEEYEKLLPRLKEHMRANGEWGKFFPAALSPFAYNETIACEYAPLTREETLSKGWKWHEKVDADQSYLGPQSTVPDDIRDATDDIVHTIFTCESSGKLYKILPQELQFYREMKLPLPRKCFMERQRVRFASRNPRKLWDRACAKCAKPIQTTYAPDRPETVHCEKCYLEAVY